MLHLQRRDVQRAVHAVKPPAPRPVYPELPASRSVHAQRLPRRQLVVRLALVAAARSREAQPLRDRDAQHLLPRLRVRDQPAAYLPRQAPQMLLDAPRARVRRRQPRVIIVVLDHAARRRLHPRRHALLKLPQLRARDIVRAELPVYRVNVRINFARGLLDQGAQARIIAWCCLPAAGGIRIHRARGGGLRAYRAGLRGGELCGLGLKCL